MSFPKELNDKLLSPRDGHMSMTSLPYLPVHGTAEDAGADEGEWNNVDEIGKKKGGGRVEAVPTFPVIQVS